MDEHNLTSRIISLPMMPSEWDIAPGENIVMEIQNVVFGVGNKHGFNRTYVYRGSIGTLHPQAAVKRIRADCFTLADCEVALLCESDEHENVVRYFCTEQDQHFRYIAMELCAATVEDYVLLEPPSVSQLLSVILAARTVPVSVLREKISPLDILRQATSGLMHLHGLNIVHGYITPRNILLSMPDNEGQVLAKISDFGLRKELKLGFISREHRIVDKMQHDVCVTMSEDIFSLGCVFYYVLSDGFHPFIDSPKVWQYKILSAYFDLRMLRPKSTLPDCRKVLAEEIIRDMIQSDGSKRPPAHAIANHPLFWSNDRVRAFLLDVRERVKNLEITVEPLFSLEYIWMVHHLRTKFEWKEDRIMVHNYRNCSVRDMLGITVTKRNGLRPELQRATHEDTDYWIDQIPHLLSHAYHAMANNSREPIFRQYYNDEEDNHTGGRSPVGPHRGYKFTKPDYFPRDDNDNDKLEQDMKTGIETGTATGPGGGSYSETIDLGGGEMRVGKIGFNKKNELGKGCEGTVVFLGSFGRRKAAVKRIRADCFRMADCEVAALCESDKHENVIRYFGTEQDRQFRYIAIELCAATLEDYVKCNKPSAVPAETTESLQKKIARLDILRQVTSGLIHLHAIGIIHRDLKPENILLSLPDDQKRVLVKISDFGLCKKLKKGKESFSRNSGVIGTDGWIAPEMQRGQRATTSVDIFSLGCVFYYVLSDGRHPFGKEEKRQANIFSGKFNLGGLWRKKKPPDNQTVLAKEIIRDMIQSDASKRPSARAIANHPLLWHNKRVLEFLQDVSNWLKGLKNMTEPLRWLEKNASFVVRDDWIHHLDAVMKDGLCKVAKGGFTRGYKTDRVQDLLRCIRNHINHYNELTPEMQRALGTMPHEVTDYWISRFPRLLSHAYHAMANNSREPIFRQYYNDEEDNHTGGRSPVGPHRGYKFTPPAYFHKDDKDNDELTNERATDMKKGNKSPSDGGSAEAGKMLTGGHNNKRGTCKSGKTMSGGFITRQQVRENDNGALDDQRASVQGADAGGENDAISDGGVNQRRRYVTATGPGNPNRSWKRLPPPLFKTILANAVVNERRKPSDI